MKKNKKHTESSGNIFEDIGTSNPEESLAKAKLAYKINKLIQEKKLTQKNAAKLLGIDQPKVSLLCKGKLTGFSLERLFRFLNILGQEITINVRPKKQSISNDDNSNNSIIFTNLFNTPKRYLSTRAAYAKKKK